MLCYAMLCYAMLCYAEALLRERFLELCATLLRAGRLPAGLDLGALQRCSYGEAKQAAAAYQQRKRALLASAPFSEWIAAPAACEAFGRGDRPAAESRDRRPRSSF